MMSCKCIDELTAQIREETGDEKAALDCTFGFNRVTGAFTARPRIQAEVRPKKKDGTFGKGRWRMVIATHCPFCGKAYDGEQA
jgi:hypothetical protein